MPFDWREIQSNWLFGLPINYSQEEIVEAFNQVEKRFSTEFFDNYPWIRGPYIVTLIVDLSKILEDVERGYCKFLIALALIFLLDRALTIDDIEIKPIIRLLKINEITQNNQIIDMNSYDATFSLEAYSGREKIDRVSLELYKNDGLIFQGSLNKESSTIDHDLYVLSHSLVLEQGSNYKLDFVITHSSKNSTICVFINDTPPFKR
ncbi:MAG: hypothetical protein L6N96_02945 [Candidatus Methylarchaceae archaeon HK02M2]|nr:hypothetical protein [Candidatus Methylarchaceae archaeon HK02M2]